MKHFEIVQALCRTALADKTPSVRRQVERLRDALLADGDESAQTLTRLLSSAERAADLRPSRLKRSALAFTGERLDARTSMPVDKETAHPLAELLLPEDIDVVRPIFDGKLSDAIDALVSEWRLAKELADVGLTPSRSCLLYGAPGTGKTALALWIAKELGLPVVLARLDGLISSFLGTTSRNIGSLFHFAARYRCLLLLDEFDAIAKLRDDPHEVGEIKRVVNTLLQNLDQRNANGLTIAITNHETLLDPAVWRRFETQIAVPRPNDQERKQIIARYFEPLQLDNAEQSLLSWLTDGTTGAELEAFVRTIRRSLIVHFNYDAYIDRLPPDFNLYEAARRYFVLNAGRIRADRVAVLNGPTEQLIHALKEEADLKQQDIARILHTSTSTISRKRNRSQAYGQ